MKGLHCLFWNHYLCNFWGVRGGGKLLQWVSISQQIVLFTFRSTLDNHPQMDQKGHRSLDLAVLEKKKTGLAPPGQSEMTRDKRSRELTCVVPRWWRDWEFSWAWCINCCSIISSYDLKQLSNSLLAFNKSATKISHGLFPVTHPTYKSSLDLLFVADETGWLSEHVYISHRIPNRVEGGMTGRTERIYIPESSCFLKCLPW